MCISDDFSTIYRPILTKRFLSSLLGPLLPENLPVQHMPITKARDLSIRLAGKLCYLSHK